MKKLGSSKFGGVGMATTFMVMVVLIAGSPVSSMTNNSEYWVEDHGYTNQPCFKRLPGGEVVPDSRSVFANFSDFREAVTAQTPVAHWVLSKQGRRALKKDLPRLLMYNLVSPMDYGSSLRSKNVRRRRNKALGMFLKDSALPLLKTLGRVAWNLIQKHYVGYVEDELFAQRLKMMNSTEIIQEFNLTVPQEEDEATRPNATLAYESDGSTRRALIYARYTVGFSPYVGYSDQYYSRDDDLPLPTLPADSYPWFWSPRLDLTRVVAMQFMSSLSQSDEDVELNAGSGAPTRHLERLNVSGSSPAAANNSSGKNTENDEEKLSSQETQAFTEIHNLLQEFYFETGIPRFTMSSNASFARFLTPDEFRQTYQETNVSQVESSSDRSQPGATRFPSSVNGSRNSTEFDFSAYKTLIHFYAYPSVDKWVVRRDPDIVSSPAFVANCSMEQECLVQSGVTIYTPTLANLTLFQSLTDGEVSSATKKKLRVDALQEMVEIAFEAERRALNHGLQAPSTVWYSRHDLDSDEFADAFLGSVNMSIADDAAPLHVFKTFMESQAPVLDEVVSYYADTNHDTKIAMTVNQTIPKLDQLEDGELGGLISTFDTQMKSLDRSIETYIQTRAADLQYQEVVNATTRGDFYNGSEYTLLRFGFVIPATNDKNVLYRDMKRPVPFHLVLRLLLRFQESHLLLPDESRQLLVCLAMSLHHLSFYKCRPSEEGRRRK